MAIIRIVKMTFQPGTEKTFQSLFNEVKGKIASFEGCTHLELWNDVEQTNVFFTYSHWLSEIHLVNYRNSDLFKTTWEKVKPLFAAKAVAWSVQRMDN